LTFLSIYLNQKIATIALILCVTHNDIFIRKRIYLNVRYSVKVSSYYEFIIYCPPQLPEKKFASALLLLEETDTSSNDAIIMV